MMDAGPFERSALPRIPTRFQRQLERKGEYEAKIPGHHELGSPVTTHERKTAAEVHQRQDRGLSTVGRHRLHRDIDGFAEGLIAIVQSQLGSDLGRAERKTELLCPLVNVCKSSLRFYAEVRGRNQRELHVHFARYVKKRGPPQNFVGSIADLNSCRIERIAVSIDTLVGAQCYRSPNPNLGFGAIIGCGRLRDM